MEVTERLTCLGRIRRLHRPAPPGEDARGQRSRNQRVRRRRALAHGSPTPSRARRRGRQPGRPGGGRDDVGRERAAAHEPREHERRGRPDGTRAAARRRSRAGAITSPAAMPERAVEARGGRAGRRRRSERAPSSGSASSSHQAPSAPSAAARPARRAAGERREGAREAGEAQQRRGAGSDQARPSPRSSSGGSETASAATSSAAPGRGEARTPARARDRGGSSQPPRGTSATRMAAASAARRRAARSRAAGRRARARPARPRRPGATARPTRGSTTAAGASSGCGAIVPPSSETSGSASASASKRSSSVAALARGRAQRAVERRAQLGRQVAAAPCERRQDHADAPRGRGRGARADRVDARQRLVEHEAERVEVARSSTARARGLLRRHVGERADDVAGARERRPRRPGGRRRSRSAWPRRGASRRSGTITFCGLTSRWITPRSWAWASASASASPIRSTSRSGQRAGGLELRERAALDQLGDEVAAAVLLAGVEQRDDRGVVEPRDRARLARARSAARPSAGIDLDRDRAAEALVARRVDGAEAAGAEARAQPVAAQRQRRARRPRGSSSVACTASRPSTRARAALPRARKGHARRRTVAAEPPHILHRHRRARARGLQENFLSFFDEDDEPRTRVRPRRPAAAGGRAADRSDPADPPRRCCRRLVLLAHPAVRRRPRLPESAQGERAEGLQPRRSPRSCASPTRRSASRSSSCCASRQRVAADLQTQISATRRRPSTQYQQAKRTSTPDEMTGAQRSFLIAMELRRDGLGRSPSRSAPRSATRARPPTRRSSEIAGPMQTFLASDVIYQARVRR